MADLDKQDVVGWLREHKWKLSKVGVGLLAAGVAYPFVGLWGVFVGAGAALVVQLVQNSTED